MQGVWRLLDEQNRGWEEYVSNYGQCDKLSEKVFSQHLLKFITTSPEEYEKNKLEHHFPYFFDIILHKT